MCDCLGAYYDNWTKWVVVQRSSSPKTSSVLRCLSCGRKWRSRAKYVDLLDDWLPRSRAGMSDEKILQRIIDGTLIVDTEKVIVWSELTPGQRSELKIIERENENGTRYRFLGVSHEGKRKKIALHRLVWIAANLRVIPDGYHVDHISGPSDSIDNLRLLKSKTNCATNGERKHLPDDYREPEEIDAEIPF